MWDGFHEHDDVEHTKWTQFKCKIEKATRYAVETLVQLIIRLQYATGLMTYTIEAKQKSLDESDKSTQIKKTNLQIVCRWKSLLLTNVGAHVTNRIPFKIDCNCNGEATRVASPPKHHFNRHKQQYRRYVCVPVAFGHESFLILFSSIVRQSADSWISPSHTNVRHSRESTKLIKFEFRQLGSIEPLTNNHHEVVERTNKLWRFRNLFDARKMKCLIPCEWIRDNRRQNAHTHEKSNNEYGLREAEWNAREVAKQSNNILR